MLTKIGKGAAFAVLILAATTATAEATCQDRKTAGTLLGAGAGSVALGAATHSPAGWVGGAVLGGVIGHSIASDGCHRYYGHRYRNGYYDRYHHWHRYAERG
jgi:hypothetical protein